MGDVSPALGMVLWGRDELLSPPLDDEEELLADDVTEREDLGDVAKGGRAEGEVEAGPDVYAETEEAEVEDSQSVASGGSSKESSEAEWEGWMGDLGRQQERSLTGGCDGRSGCSLGTMDKVSLFDADREGDPTTAAVIAQRLTLEGRRALEPSAVVGLGARSRSRATVQMGGGLSASSTVASSVSFSPLSSSSVSGTDWDATPSPVGQGMVEYKVPLKTKMSVEKVLETTRTQQAVVETSGRSTGAPPAQALSTRKRSATTAVAESFSYLDMTANRPSTAKSVSSLASFGGKKGKDKDKDGSGSLSKKDRKASGVDKDKTRLASFLSSSLSSATAGPSGPAEEAMASSTSLSPSVTATGSPLSTSESGSIRSNNAILRHVRSGSSLHDSSERTTGGRRVGLGLVRGVSVRAGKLVRGLDAALDFVDSR